MGAVCSIPVFKKSTLNPTRVDLNPVRAKGLSAPLYSRSAIKYSHHKPHNIIIHYSMLRGIFDDKNTSYAKLPVFKLFYLRSK
jgi:hypothetical protein